MTAREYLDNIGISQYGEETQDNSYVVSIENSNEYGKVFSTLENSDDLDIMKENQVVTEQGSSLMYESLSENFILNLLADFDNNVYQLVITEVGD